MQIAQARPPYVEFKRIAVHDPVRTEQLGRRVTKDVDMAFIMQPGSRDQVERVAADWLKSIKTKMLEGSPDAYPEEWVSQFHNKYKAWQEGQDAPLNGTSVKEWPILSPSQAENFISLRVMTVEDVAVMTEDALAHFGMGARELREKAREWLKGREATADLQKENEELKRQLQELAARMNDLEADKPKRGRRAKADEPETVE